MNILTAVGMTLAVIALELVMASFTTLIDYFIEKEVDVEKIQLAVLCFEAPISEEIAKMLSIKMGLWKEFFVIFNVAEMLLFIIKMMQMNIKLSASIKIRLIAVGIHVLCTAAHLTGHHEVGFLIHILWNYIGNTTDLQKKINKLCGV